MALVGDGIAASQEYLNGQNGWSLGRDYERMDLCYDALLNVGTAKAKLAKHAVKRMTEGSAVEGVGMSVTFGSSTAIDLVVKPKKGASLSGTATFGDSDIVLKQLEDGRWHVRIEGIRPQEYDRALKVAGDCGGAFSVEASVLSYANSVYNDEHADDKARAAMASAWQLYKAASDYAKLHRSAA